MYDAFETPRAVRGDLPLLDTAGALGYLDDVRERSLRRARAARARRRHARQSSWLRHELQHTETMRQAMALGGPAAGRRAARGADRGRKRLGRGAAAARSRWAPDRTASPTTTSARAMPSTSRRSRSPAGRSRTRPGARGSRRRTGTTARPPAPATRTHRSATSAGTTPTRTRAPRARGCRPRLSGRRRTRPARSTTIGYVWEWTSIAVRRLSRLRGPSVPRVLRGVLRRRLSRAARRLVGDRSPGRDADVPQLGSAGAPADLLRPAARARSGGAGVSVTLRSVPGPADESSLADDVLDGLTRPFKELPPKYFYDAAGAELFDRISDAARVLPDARRAGDPRRARRRDRGADGRGGGRRAGLGERGEDPARAQSALAERGHAAPLRARRRDREHGPGDRRRADRRVPGARGGGDRRRLRAPPRPAARPRPARASWRCSAARSATSRPARGVASCAASRRLLGPDGALLLGVDLVKDPARIEAAYDDSRRPHRRVQPQRPARRQSRARRRLRARALRTRRVLRPRARVDRDAPARAAADDRARSPTSG